MKALVLATAAAALSYPTDTLLSWREGAVYAVSTRPGRVTDIVLQPGEALGAVNPVAAGDTARWIIGDSESGAGPSRQVHVLVKPVDPGIATNLIIATDRRTYHLELRSSAGAYMSNVSWRYPADELAALGRRQAPAATELLMERKPSAAPVDLAPDALRLSFGYALEGAAAFRPLRVYDDGRRTYIDFPPSIATGEMPPLFVLGPDRRTAELANYRVAGRRMVVDRIFEAAELRLGAGKAEERVRIRRDASAK